MDPISALIGGGASLLGAYMNTSSQQAINTQNLQYAESQASGQFLPQYYKHLVSGAEAAGINPLAALGVNNPSPAVNLESGRPGAGLQQLGANISQVNMREEAIRDATLRKLEIDIANGRTLGNNAAIQGEKQSILNRQLEGFIARHPYAIPEGLQYPTTSDVLEELRTMGGSVGGGNISDWVRNRIDEGFRALGPTGSWPQVYSR